VQVVGDGAVVAGLATPAFGEGQGDVLRVHIETGKQYFFLHGVLAVFWLIHW
jgi:hypothetical protein